MGVLRAMFSPKFSMNKTERHFLIKNVPGFEQITHADDLLYTLGKPVTQSIRSGSARTPCSLLPCGVLHRVSSSRRHGLQPLPSTHRQGVVAWIFRCAC